MPENDRCLVWLYIVAGLHAPYEVFSGVHGPASGEEGAVEREIAVGGEPIQQGRVRFIHNHQRTKHEHTATCMLTAGGADAQRDRRRGRIALESRPQVGDCI